MTPPRQLQGNGREDEEEASWDEKNITSDEKNISGELERIFSEETRLRYLEDEMAAGIRERSRVFVASDVSRSRPGAVAVPGVRGRTEPSVLGEPRVPSFLSQPSLIVAELVEPSQEDESLRRRNQDLERIVGVHERIAVKLSPQLSLSRMMRK
jgi:hypothetical protein